MCRAVLCTDWLLGRLTARGWNSPPSPPRPADRRLRGRPPAVWAPCRTACPAPDRRQTGSPPNGPAVGDARTARPPLPAAHRPTSAPTAAHSTYSAPTPAGSAPADVSTHSGTQHVERAHPCRQRTPTDVSTHSGTQHVQRAHRCRQHTGRLQHPQRHTARTARPPLPAAHRPTSAPTAAHST